MVKLKLLALVIAVTSMSSVASAQQMDCSMFRHNENGSWSPTKPLTLRGPNGSVQLSPGVSFTQGAYFMGVNLAALLDQQCR